MGLVKASIEYKKSLEDLEYAIGSMPSEIERIDDPEVRGMFKYLQSQIEESYNNLKETSEKLLNEIDKIV